MIKIVRPVAAGGIYEQWPGRGYCWFAAREGGFDRRLWPSITQAVKAAADRGLSTGTFRRVEMTIYDSHEAAKRWAVKLGFRPEALCEKLMPDGSDGGMYVRVQ